MNTYGVTDRQVASILANTGYPDKPLIEWDDETKDQFLGEYMERMSSTGHAEVWSEVAGNSAPSAMARLYTDPDLFMPDIRCGIYIYLEDVLQDQIERARSIIARGVQSDIDSGLMFAAQG